MSVKWSDGWDPREYNDITLADLIHALPAAIVLLLFLVALCVLVTIGGAAMDVAP